ncbi:MAG: hypothetical protein JNL83_18740 [Myxococcales bacterium]|nr:hypothetical protein [Myxococcales bacterium]
MIARGRVAPREAGLRIGGRSAAAVGLGRGLRDWLEVLRIDERGRAVVVDAGPFPAAIGRLHDRVMRQEADDVVLAGLVGRASHVERARRDAHRARRGRGARGSHHALDERVAQRLMQQRDDLALRARIAVDRGGDRPRVGMTAVDHVVDLGDAGVRDLVGRLVRGGSRTGSLGVAMLPARRSTIVHPIEDRRCG